MAGKVNRRLIEDKISEIEGQTEAEIVPVILSTSDDYNVAHYRFSVFITLITTLLFSFIIPEYLIFLCISSFFLAFIISKTFGPWALFLTAEEIYTETMQMAYQLFLEQKIHLTQHRSGVLVFYSLLEKRIIILCDSLISEKIENKVWDEIIQKNLELIKVKNLSKSFTVLLEDVSKVLTREFPLEDVSSKKVLDDKLITDIS